MLYGHRRFCTSAMFLHVIQLCRFSFSSEKFLPCKFQVQVNMNKVSNLAADRCPLSAYQPMRRACAGTVYLVWCNCVS